MTVKMLKRNEIEVVGNGEEGEREHGKGWWKEEQGIGALLL